MKKTLFTLIITLISVNLFGQNFTLNDFKIDSIPRPHIDMFEKLNRANNPSVAEELKKEIEDIKKNNWKIKMIKDSIKISINDFNYFKGDSLPFSQKQIAKKIKNHYSIRAVKKVSDGYIIGLNGGEFGGGLWFLSTNGKKSYEITSYIRVKDIFIYNNKLYVIRGLAHLGSSYGSILELKKEKKWRAAKSFKLPGAPNFILHEKENILILTSEHLLSFDKNEKLTEILKAPFYWGMFYPSSAIVESDDIYIAMRRGILKISEFKYKPNYEWLVKK